MMATSLDEDPLYKFLGASLGGPEKSKLPIPLWLPLRRQLIVGYLVPALILRRRRSS